MRGSIALAAALLALAAPAYAQEGASSFTRAANAAVAQTLPPEGDAATSDEAFAARGLRAEPQQATINAADGRVLWDFNAFSFIHGAAPDTVNPSLWRHARLLDYTGVFEVAPGVFQARGFDVSNVTFIVGRTGLIVIDPLTSVEAAAAALALARTLPQIGQKPVRALIYTHSHADHFAGARGIVDGAALQGVRIIAPEGFLEHAVSENLIAGPAMTRRATYQFGSYLAPGAEGTLGSGIGMGIPGGIRSLIPPNETVTRTGQELTIDGVRFVFQVTPNTEAPAEMNFYLPDLRVLDLAENANVSMHNILTPRGALVRDAKAWADYLTESLRLFPQAEVMMASHGWPRWGQAVIVDYVASHRDAYKYLHDQSVRLMNQGYTGAEIAERIALPEALNQRWFNRGYYGTMRHNSRAVYQRYMGWYDGVPAHLNGLEPEAAARNYVRMMGGARRVLREGQRANAAGEYRWAAEVLDRLVFAEPTNEAAKQALAQAYTQLAYQAESAIWRNIYLAGASELRGGVRPSAAQQTATDYVANTPTGQFFDLLAVRLDPERAAGRNLRLNFVFPDRNERVAVQVRNSVLIHEEGVMLPDADATITLPRAALLAAMSGAGAGQAAAAARIEGNGAAVAQLFGLFTPPAPDFPIVTP